VGRDSLVICSSYSGNTEETLSGFDDARRRGARVLVLTTGGKLAELGAANGFPVVTFTYPARPRAVLGYSLGLVLGVLSRLGFVKDLGPDVEAALGEVDRLQERVHEGARTNEAKRLAAELYGKVPFVYGAGVMSVVARRVKGQWNENAKAWAAFDAMPELNHNAVVGFPNPALAKDALVVLLLRSAHDNPRIQARWEVTKELLDRAGVPHRTLQFEGSNALSEVLQQVYFTDHVTFYLALLNRADPSPNTSIDFLKDRLAKV
jgi:glucose/mannose-6-phosphate isomerase